MEVVAYRLTSMEPHEAAADYLLQHLLNVKDGDQLVYPDMERAQIVASINLADQLLALGEKPVNICHLGQINGGWDKGQQTYPVAASRIREICAEKNIKPSDLPQLVDDYRRKNLTEKKQVQDYVLLALGVTRSVSKT
jgi:hypothetical protein